MKKLLTIMFVLIGLSVIAQKGDSAYYLSVSNGQIVTLTQVDGFHESDDIICNSVNKATPSETTMIFYNQTPADYAVYVWYVLRDNIVIKSRCVRVYYPKTAKK